jgi:hypothetical protein
VPRGVHNGHARGSAHPRWNHGRMTTKDGYVKVRVGTSHPAADGNGYAYEHDLVMATANGRPLADRGRLGSRVRTGGDERWLR